MKNEMRFVVFLDVDGVLNTRKTCVSAPSKTCVGVDAARLLILANSIKETDAAGVVLTTTWKNLRHDHEDYIYLIDSLEKYGIKVLGETEEPDHKLNAREEGILAYLKSHPEIEEFVILDDNHYGFEDYSKLWESFIDTKAKGIESSVAASKTPSVAAILFLDAIEKYSAD